MKRVERFSWLAALLGVILTLLAGCSLIPQPSKTIDQLAGVWRFIDSQGETSTMIIEGDGQFAVDRAPQEAFRVMEPLDSADWGGVVDWERAKPISGLISIGQSGQIRFSTRAPDWGGSAAYENPSRDSLEFLVGNVDNAESIDYFRVGDR